MSFLKKTLGRLSLTRFAANTMEEVVSEGASSLIRKAADHWQGHHAETSEAIQSAWDRSWLALELWLDPDRWGAKLASSDDRSLRQCMDAFFQVNGESLVAHDSPLAFRQLCLRELTDLRQSDLFKDDGSYGVQALALELSEFGHFANPTRLVERYEELLQQVPLILESRWPSLAKLLSHRAGERPSFLITAHEYYFFESVRKNPELVARLNWLGQRRQNQMLDALLHAQAQHGQQFASMLEEQAGLRASIESMRKELHDLLSARHLERRLLNSRDSFTIRNDAELEILRRFRDFWRSLGQPEQGRCSDLLRLKVKTEFAAGHFHQALADAQALVNIAPDLQVRVEGHYHCYRAALEEKKWDIALASLKEAVLANPELAPLPFDRYEPIKILGMGGFGVVFLCRELHFQGFSSGNDNDNDDDDDDHDDRVVVKALAREEFGAGLNRAFLEVRALRRINNDAIIRVYDGDYVNRSTMSGPYVSMAYFRGVALDDFIEHRQKPLSILAAVIMARKLAAALHVVHQSKLLHRDIKPGNILVRVRDGQTLEQGLEIKLIDFGLAQRLEVSISTTPGRAESMRNASVNGSLDYIAPELRKGEPHTIQSDLFSFGRTCFYALFETPHPSLRERSSMPRTLNLLLDSCCETKTAKRPKDFAEVARALTQIENELRNPKPPEQPKSEPEPRIQRPPEEPTLPPPPPGDKRVITQLVREMPPKPGAPRPQFLDYAKKLREQSRTKILFRRLEAGEFEMGSNEYDGEKPIHKVRITHPFEIGIFPITQAQYQLVMKESPSHFKNQPDNPVETVSWIQAAKFCNALSEKEGLPCYYRISGDNVASDVDPRGYRLPTEEEWEYAARAGTKTRFPWGDDYALLKDHAWFNENSGSATQPVGLKLPNPYGLYDTLGNVWEWCEDWFYENYKDKQLLNNSARKAGRVLRGGSWDSNSDSARPAFRLCSGPAICSSGNGFRVLRALS